MGDQLGPVDAVDAVHDLRAEEYVRIVNHRASFLAHVATGNLDHLREPIAWFASKKRVVYQIGGTRDLHCRRVEAALALHDPDARRAFFHLLRDEVWRPWLEDRGWECEGSRDLGATWRSPSGMAYELGAGPVCPALDAALARECLDHAVVFGEARVEVNRVRDRLKAARGKARG